MMLPCFSSASSIFFGGHGEEADAIEAYKWLLLADGDERSKEVIAQLEEAVIRSRLRRGVAA